MQKAFFSNNFLITRLSLFLAFMGSTYGTIIPIANGNTWVYTYSDTVLNYTISPVSPIVKKAQTGTHKMLIDTVWTISDSVFFSLITIDSGVSYLTRSANLFKTFKDSLYKKDTALISWIPYYDDFLCYRPHCDTNYNCQVIDHYDPNGISWGTIYGIDSHSDTIPAIINNAILRNTYLSDTVFSWEYSVFDYSQGIYLDKKSVISRDTSLWIDSIGLLYHINNSDSVHGSDFNTTTKDATHFREVYYLFSFNGVPISVVPTSTNLITVNSKPHRSFITNNNKVLFLKTTSFREMFSSSYFNLLGRKQSYFGSAQILIKKNINVH
jgi:hypothetical protein